MEPEGFEVRWVHDGDEGLRLALSECETFDLIILDIMLPGKNGFEVLQNLRTMVDTPVS